MASDRVGKKIRKLRAEGMPQKQAVAVSLNMNREGRLTKEGGYKRKKKKEPTHDGSKVGWLHG